jgi:hypothetical protein
MKCESSTNDINQNPIKTLENLEKSYASLKFNGAIKTGRTQTDHKRESCF